MWLYLYNGLLLSFTKDQTTDTYRNKDEPQKQAKERK